MARPLCSVSELTFQVSVGQSVVSHGKCHVGDVLIAVPIDDKCQKPEFS